MKERLDVILVNNGLASSRDNAKRTIMAGLVTVDGIVETKSGQKFDVDSEFKVKDKLLKYVSRGGLKLEKAIQSFNIKLNGCYAVDMGASTGGFTDCMLMNGALKVYALDVGYGQLDYKLRVDPRVINMEKTNIRYLDTTLIEEPIDFISIDVSFISLSLILPNLAEIIKDGGEVCALVKPQFEAGKDKVGKGGIVRDKKVQLEVVEKVLLLANSVGFSMTNLSYSPITGGEGNIEFLMLLKYNANKEVENSKINIEHIVNNAHNHFK